MIALRNYIRSSWIGRLLLFPGRMKLALAATLPPVGQALVWTFKSREHHNFTYELLTMLNFILTPCVPPVAPFCSPYAAGFQATST